MTAPEVADESAWIKSSYSNDTGGACLEVAVLEERVGIRDSKNKTGSAVLVSQPGWSSFVESVRSHDL
ncbi:DUF397 domain-containing protein [Streptomyces sp. NPDC007083]|uniref:DUF397 domain-containing protein n=1 Tax=Streptomyces sp. NPDC007083 TaxID=3156913 RepID=UPI0034104E7E